MSLTGTSYIKRRLEKQETGKLYMYVRETGKLYMYVRAKEFING